MQKEKYVKSSALGKMNAFIIGNLIPDCFDTFLFCQIIVKLIDYKLLYMALLNSSTHFTRALELQ